jgi:hypothetical protein
VSNFVILIVLSNVNYGILVLLRLFFASVTVEWTERPKGRGGKAKKYDETKPTPQCHAILSFSHVEFVIAALSAHGYEKIYEPGEKNGPAFKIPWAGSP